MSVVPISTGRSKEVPHVSKALIERSLDSLFSHLGLQSGAKMRGIEGGMSTSSLLIVLGSSIVSYDGKYLFNNIISFIFYIITNFCS